MTLPMDVRIAAEGAHGLRLRQRGIVPEACRLVPAAWSASAGRQVVYTGRVFAASGNFRGRTREPGRTGLLLDTRGLAADGKGVGGDVDRALAPDIWRMLGANHPSSAQVDSRAIFAMGSQCAPRGRGVVPRESGRLHPPPSKDMPSFYPWWPEEEFE
jgi:hypothetical protein